MRREKKNKKVKGVKSKEKGRGEQLMQGKGAREKERNERREKECIKKQNK